MRVYYLKVDRKVYKLIQKCTSDDFIIRLARSKWKLLYLRAMLYGVTLLNNQKRPTS